METVTVNRCPRVFSPTVLIRDDRRQELSLDLPESLPYLQRISELRFQLLCRNCPTCQNLTNNRTSGSPSLSLKSAIGHHHGYPWFNESVPCVTNSLLGVTNSLRCHEASAVARYSENNLNDQDERVTNKTKVFMCPYCPVTCSNRGQLLGHVRIHTGERPFVCQEPGCNKAFIRNEELTRHRRIHTGERPYRCTTCTKAFTRKDHLNKHVKIHLTDDSIPRS